MNVMFNVSGPWGQAEEALSGGEPQQPRAILADVKDERNGVSMKCLCSKIESVQKLAASDPERAGSIFKKRANHAPAETVGLVRIIDERSEVVAVVPVQPVLRTEPRETLIVLHNLQNPGLGQALRSREPIEANIVGVNGGQTYDMRHDTPLWWLVVRNRQHRHPRVRPHHKSTEASAPSAKRPTRIPLWLVLIFEGMVHGKNRALRRSIPLEMGKILGRRLMFLERVALAFQTKSSRKASIATT